MTSDKVVVRPIDQLKNVLGSTSVKEQFNNALKDNAPLFTASVVDLFTSDNNLQKCNPQLVVMEALKAAVLKLPISKGLGFAYIVPYKEKGVQTPHFQLGYKGLIQLAKRSGLYSAINADFVYDGETVTKDRMTGNIEIKGSPVSNEIIGYFAYFRETNGFEKAIYRTRKEAEDHAKKYSKTYQYKIGAWKTEDHKMHRKGVLRALLSNWGTLSIEISMAISKDIKDDSVIEADFKEEGATLDDAINNPIRNTGGTDSLADLATGKPEASKVACPDGGNVQVGECGQCGSRAGCPTWDDTDKQSETEAKQPISRKGNPPPTFS